MTGPHIVKASPIGRPCARCTRKYRGRGAWNVVTRAGVITDLLCPRCQTTAENAEAEINDATLDYARSPLGLVVAKPKTQENDR